QADDGIRDRTVTGVQTCALPICRAEMEQRQANMRQRLAKLAPQIAFLDAIRAELPEDGIFVDEVTQIGFAARLLFPVYKPRTFRSEERRVGKECRVGWGAEHA